MIQASPNPHSLDLAIEIESGCDATPSNRLSSSSSVKLHDLRTYRASGTVDPNWLSFFEAPDTNDFRLLLQLHPHLHTVAIGSSEWIQVYDSVDLETLPGLLPCL